MTPHDPRSTPRQEADRLLLAAGGDGWVSLDDIKGVMRDYVMPGPAHRRAAARRKAENGRRVQDALTVGKTAAVNLTVSNALRKGGKWERSECGTKVRHRDWVPLPQITDARRQVDVLRAMLVTPDVANIVTAIVSIWDGRLWRELGYESWDDFTASELSGAPRLTVEMRQRVVAQLREAGMSTRAIGSALGVSEGTVRNDLLGAQDYAPEPKPVTGLDGKTYQPNSKATPADLPAPTPKKKKGDHQRPWHVIFAKSNDPVEMAALLKKHKPDLVRYLYERREPRRNRNRTHNGVADVIDMGERRA